MRLSLPALALLLMACPGAAPGADAGGDPLPRDGGPAAPNDAGAEDAGPSLLSLEVQPAPLSLTVGSSVRLSARGTYADGANVQLTHRVAWSSDAPDVAEVGTEGAELARVSARAPGAAAIRAELDGVVGQVSVTVVEVVRALVALEISPASASVSAGEPVQLVATGTFDDDAVEDVSAAVSWSSSAESVATVDGAGLVVTHAAGSASIEATLQGQAASSDVSVGPPVVVQVATFNKHSAALLSTGRVLAFGHNRYGQTGVAPPHAKGSCEADLDCNAAETCDVQLQGKGVCSTSCVDDAGCPTGDMCDCVEREAGECIKGWCIDVVTSPTLVPGVTDARQVATAGFTTFALRDDGTLLGWGRNTRGLFLGDGDDDGRAIETTPRQVMRQGPAGLQPLEDIVELKGGLDHVVARDASGQVWSWGRGWVGQLGNGETTRQSSAVQVTHAPAAEGEERSPVLAEAIGAGAYHSLAVEAGTGRVLAWGWNSVGQLGQGNNVGPVGDDPDTAEVDGQGYADPTCVLAAADGDCLAGATRVDGGWAHSLALVDGQVFTWGWNGRGQLGDDSTEDRWLPAAVGLTDVVTIESGFSHLSAQRSNGALFLWGKNADGQLGDGTSENRLAPAVLSLPASAMTVSAGSDHVMALLDDGRVLVWGYNSFGELGLGDRTTRDLPVQSAALSP